MDKVEPEEEAKKATWQDVKGKIKETVGSVIGSEKLVASGELQQAEADARREAAEAQGQADRLRDQAVSGLVAQEERLAREHARTIEEEAGGLAEAQVEEELQKSIVQEEAETRAQAAERLAEQKRQEIALQEQQAAREREAVGREAAEQRRAAAEARAATSDLEVITESSDKE